MPEPKRLLRPPRPPPPPLPSNSGQMILSVELISSDGEVLLICVPQGKAVRLSQPRRPPCRCGFVLPGTELTSSTPLMGSVPGCHQGF